MTDMKPGPKRSDPLYPIRAAARLARLSIDTLRAWEKRYGVVKPARRNGIRMYRESDIARLSLLRAALEQGHTIGQAARLSPKALERAVRPQVGTSRQVAARETLLEPILDAVERFDAAGADRELGRLAALMSPRELVYEVALPLMRITGEHWHEQRFRIAQEHMMSQLLASLLGGMMRLYSSRQAGVRILMAALSGDYHQFGLQAAALLAAGVGSEVVHLGANLPAAEVIHAARKSHAGIVLLSITGPHDLLLVRAEVRSIRAALPTGVEVWVGLNPPTIELGVKGLVIVGDFQSLENELLRIGGKL